jgi:hypothetical protein
MNNSVFKSLSLCLFALCSCHEEQELLSAESDRVPLQVSFAQGTNDMFLQESGGRSLVTGLGTAGKGNIDRIGVYITGADHGKYLNEYDKRYTYTTADNGQSWTAYAGNNPAAGDSPAATLYLTNKEATLYAFYPTTSVAVTDGNSSANHNIPVTIPASQTFVGGSDWECSATDYLYGTSGPSATSSNTPITAHNLAAAPHIYMQHAMAKVIFNIEYEPGATKDNDYVWSIELKDESNNSFFSSAGGTGTMNIKTGTLSSLTGTNTLTFTASSNPQRIGRLSATTVAFGLVAPLTADPSKVTLTVKLGTETAVDTDEKKFLTLSSDKAPDLKVQWKSGYCYIYNLKLSTDLSVKRISAGWEGVKDDIPIVTPKEKGISSAAELIAFAELWNANGLSADATADDYKKYEPYGWYEKDNNGKEIFTIKLTSSFKIETAKDGWMPIGTEAHPLTIPFDGQGWQVIFDMVGQGQTVPSGVKYAGLIGYTTSNVKNVRVLTTVSGEVTSETNFMDAGAAPYAGILAARVDGDITNCTVEMQGTAIKSSPGGTTNPDGSSTVALDASTSATYVGGMVGYCGGNISNSAVYLYEGTTPKITIAGVSGINSYMGGLAGHIEGKMSNCYTRITTLENSNVSVSSVQIGLLAGAIATGDASSIGFTNCYTYGGTVTGCETPTTGDGITTINSFTGTDKGSLCTLLNDQLNDNPSWSTWTEKKDGTGAVTSVYLFNYRN